MNNKIPYLQTTSIKKVDKYTKDSYTYPHTNNPQKKGKKYCIAMAEAIYSSHLRNRTGIFYSEQADFSRLRAYGNGEQPPEYYKEFFSGEQEGETPVEATVTDTDGTGGWTHTPSGKRKGYMNVLWDVVSTAPKIKSTLLQYFEKAEFDVVVDAIDEFSNTEKEKEKWTSWFISQNKNFVSRYVQRGNIPMQEPELLPGTLEQLELFEERGGFKPVYAKVMEMLVSHTQKMSDWEEIKRELYADAIDIGYFGIKDYYDEEDGFVKTRYVDPACAVVQYSKYPDFRDSEYAGEYVTYTISELRERGFSEKELQSIASFYSDYEGNPPHSDWQMYAVQNDAGGYLYDFYKVCVLDVEWVDMDSQKDIVRINRFGKQRVIKNVDLDKEIKENEKQQVRVIDKRMVYGIKWIVGTEYAFDYGKVYDILRPQKSKVSLTYHFYRLSFKSFTRQLIPIYDNLMILWVKYQNAIAQAANQGYAINYDAIANMSLGGQKNEEKEILRRFLETGILIFKETNAMKNRNIMNKPVHELPGGMGQIFQEIQQGFRFNIELTENLTGLSPLTLGGTPDPKAPVKTSEMSLIATNNNLRSLMSGYLNIKQRMARNCVNWIQIKVKQGGDIVESYQRIIGKEDVQILKIAEQKHVMYGTHLMARPSDAEKSDILESAKISLQNNRDGKPGINESDYFAILHILNSGTSYRLAEMILHDRITKARQEADKLAKENMELQHQETLALDKMKSDNKLREIVISEEEKRKTNAQEILLKIVLENPSEELQKKRIAEFESALRRLEIMEQNQMNQQNTQTSLSNQTPSKTSQNTVNANKQKA